MLAELHVVGLGVIDDCRIRLSGGLTALTGETGAGKTLFVDALDLVLGGKPRRGLVPEGRSALIEAVFDDGEGGELVLAREIPSQGRARAWIDGRMASAAALEERARGLCDIYGQHEHQSLLGAGSVRRALDAYGSIDSSDLRRARGALRQLEEERRVLGGAPEAIAREIALLEHQIGEIDAAQLGPADELERLLEQAQLLGSAAALRLAIGRGIEQLDRDGEGPRDHLSKLSKDLEGFAELEELHGQLRSAEEQLTELISSLRGAFDHVEEDPARLEEVNARLELLTGLCRRYANTIPEVIQRREEMADELSRLQQGELARCSLDERLLAAGQALAEVEKEVEAERRAKAPLMATAIVERLSSLALERARVELSVSGPGGDDVELLFSANPGLAPQPVARVASGGELARVMLAIRLTLPGGPATMVFDEVDAGVGGATARTLADALREVAADRQVLVVTHLAQVAAVADRQLAVTKSLSGDSTSAEVSELDEEARIVELARMLSGQPDSDAARRHASELLGR